MWKTIAVSAARRVTYTASKTIATKQVGALSMRLRTLSSMSYGESITDKRVKDRKVHGGFYGSGGARVSKLETEHRPEMMALAADVENLTLLMEEVYKLDATLKEEKDEHNSSVTAKSLEISSKIKKIMTSHDVMDCLNRLEVNGEPVWGLSSEERDLVHEARQKVNEC